MRHRARRPEHEWNRTSECIVEEKGRRIGLEILRQHAARLQIGYLARRERNQFADAFVKTGRGSNAQERRNLGPRISHEVITVTELVMRGEEPLRVRLDALERANVILKIDVPAGCMRILLPLVARMNRIEIGFGPKTRGQFCETQTSVKLFGCFHDPFRRPAFESIIDVCRLNQPGPFLAPSIVNPVRRNLLRHQFSLCPVISCRSRDRAPIRDPGRFVRKR